MLARGGHTGNPRGRGRKGVLPLGESRRLGVRLDGGAGCDQVARDDGRGRSQGLLKGWPARGVRLVSEWSLGEQPGGVGRS